MRPPRRATSKGDHVSSVASSPISSLLFRSLTSLSLTFLNERFAISPSAVQSQRRSHVTRGVLFLGSSDPAERESRALPHPHATATQAANPATATANALH